jgi:hypothetical protein
VTSAICPNPLSAFSFHASSAKEKLLLLAKAYLLCSDPGLLPDRLDSTIGLEK